MADTLELVHVTSREQWREWLAANHDTSQGVWFVAWRRPDLGPRVEYEDMVRECLCFGWIDSTARAIDEERSAIRLTPRRKGSGWSRTNKVRLTELTTAGQMMPAGLRAVERAKLDGSWTLLDDVEDLTVPPDLAAALAAANAATSFAALTPGRRKQLLLWIKTAKRAPTRDARIAKVTAAAADGLSALE